MFVSVEVCISDVMFLLLAVELYVRQLQLPQE